MKSGRMVCFLCAKIIPDFFEKMLDLKEILSYNNQGRCGEW